MTQSRSGNVIGTEPQKPVICVIEDDASVRAGLDSLFRSVGHHVELFASAAEYLARPDKHLCGCLVVDIRLPGMSGLDFQAELARVGKGLPIVFMTGHGDIEMSVRAMKAGAIDFLEKPFRDQDMLDAVATAIDRDRVRMERDRAGFAVRSSFDSLTPREREIMALVTAGLMNKQIAARVGLSEITVKIHRGHVMSKMAAGSLADLVRMAETLGITADAKRYA